MRAKRKGRSSRVAPTRRQVGTAAIIYVRSFFGVVENQEHAEKIWDAMTPELRDAMLRKVRLETNGVLGDTSECLS